VAFNFRCVGPFFIQETESFASILLRICFLHFVLFDEQTGHWKRKFSVPVYELMEFNLCMLNWKFNSSLYSRYIDKLLIVSEVWYQCFIHSLCYSEYG
jgi:hypothetical protein